MDKRIHFIGEVKNIYSLLKNIDFFINSFPTSGGSNIEAAYVGKPTIEFIHNRNLTLHPNEFLSSRECIVTNKLEFKKLANRFINDKLYRQNLGEYLQKRVIREYNKNDIIKEQILDAFKDKYEQKLSDGKTNEDYSFQEALDYEKNIAFFNSYLQSRSRVEKQIIFLKQLITKYQKKHLPG